MNFDRRAIEGHLRAGRWALTRADFFPGAIRARVIGTVASSLC
jgi:hypothetical protein